MADEAMLGGERLQQMTPDRTLPVVFEMVEPVGRLDQRQTLADFGIGDANAVRRRAEMDFLAQARRRLRCLRGCVLARGSRLRRFRHRADKADALAGDGADQALLLATV